VALLTLGHGGENGFRGLDAVGASRPDRCTSGGQQQQSAAESEFFYFVLIGEGSNLRPLGDHRRGPLRSGAVEEVRDLVYCARAVGR